MPVQNLRLTAPSTTSGRRKTSGNITVTYRDANGKSQNAVVLGRGSVSGLKLKVGTAPGKQIIDNVPKATSVNDTGCYFFHQGG